MHAPRERTDPDMQLRLLKLTSQVKIVLNFRLGDSVPNHLSTYVNVVLRAVKILSDAYG